MPYAHVTGWGMAVPESILTNEDLSKMVDTSDAWIRDHTGIRERRIARDGESPATLGAEAAMRALRVANLHPADLDMIICATGSPEYIFPATACLIQDQIGATKAGAFDLLAACSGFVFAMNMATQAIKSCSIKNALVVGAETLSRFVDWTDRNTCILFGDGAGAFVLQASGQAGGVLSAVMHSDGSGASSLSLPVNSARFPATPAVIQEEKHFIHMNGGEVFRFATRVMTSVTQEVIGKAGLTTNQVAWIVPHQANIRIIDAAARGLKLPVDRFIVNLDRYGNTSAASIPIATVEAVEKGQIKTGDKIVFVGFGGGLAWGALTVAWSGPMERKGKIYFKQYRWYARMRSFLRRMIRFMESIIFRKEF